MSFLLIILMVWLAGWIVALRPVGKKYLEGGPVKESWHHSNCPTYMNESRCREAHGMRCVTVRGGPRDRSAGIMWAISAKSIAWPLLLIGEGIKAMVPMSEAERQAQRDQAAAEAKAIEEQTAKELEELLTEGKRLDKELYELRSGKTIEDEIESKAFAKAQVYRRQYQDDLAKVNANFRAEVLKVKEALWKDHLNGREPSIDVDKVSIDPKALSKKSRI